MHPLNSCIQHLFPFPINCNPSAHFDVNKNELLPLYQFLITTDYGTTFVLPDMKICSQTSNMYNVDMLNCVWTQLVFNIDICTTVVHQFLFLVQKNTCFNKATTILNLCHNDTMQTLNCILHPAQHIGDHRCEHCERQQLFHDKKRCVIPLLIDTTWLLVVRDADGKKL